MQKFKHPIITEDAIAEVGVILRSGNLSSFRGSPEGHDGGVWVQKLEQAFGGYFGIRYAVAMNSATACLHAACIACGIGAGDEVIVSPYTFVSSASCVVMVRARPVFVDIEDETFCIDPDKIEEAITWRTRAIIPVHLMGHPAEMDRIMEIAKHYGLWIIEDAAQAIGARYKDKLVGTIGDCGVFSFNQSKPISTGEGGMLITDNPHIARIAKAVRNHGEVSDPELGIVGYNYRLCEIEAALAYNQFLTLDECNNRRIRLAGQLSGNLDGIEGFTPPVTRDGCRHVFYTYAVKFNRQDISRDEFQDEMMRRGVYFGKGYVKPLYLLPLFGGQEGLCPVTERMWSAELMVTDIIRPPMVESDVYEIIDTIKDVLSARTTASY